MTNGDVGHFEKAGGPLAKRRKAEVAECARILGIETEVLDIHDGELTPSLENRKTVARLIRDWQADIVLSIVRTTITPIIAIRATWWTTRRSSWSRLSSCQTRRRRRATRLHALLGRLQPLAVQARQWWLESTRWRTRNGLRVGDAVTIRGRGFLAGRTIPNIPKGDASAQPSCSTS